MLTLTSSLLVVLVAIMYLEWIELGETGYR